MSSNSKKYVRNFYRMRFPRKERPQLIVNGESHDVIELSEGGLRVIGTRLRGGVNGLLRLSDGTERKVRGLVGRKTRLQTILIELRGIDFQTMIEEQRRLARKYGA